MKTKVVRAYSKLEEILSASVHGVGILLGIAAVALLVTFSAIYQDAWAVVGCAIFGATFIILYLASTLYHAVTNENAKRKLKKFDHIAIYYLIAGTYTPFLLSTIRSKSSWIIFGIIWGLAILGTILKLCTSGGGTKIWSVGLYLGMGWLSVIIIGDLIKLAPPTGVIFLAAGGISYTLGVIFYVQKSKPYTHAIWHIFVLAGTVLHFFSVLFACALK